MSLSGFNSKLFLAFLASAFTSALSSFDDWPHLRVALQDVSIHLRYFGTGPPILLVHGNPQYSLTWRTIGPILAQNYTVIAPDNRGAGDSSIPPDGNYTAAASADDLKAVLDFLNITETYVFSHDKGAGMASALAAKHGSSLVKRLGVSEYALPGGFGYEQAATPGYWFDLYQNWQLVFFSIPDAAEFFIRDRERQMLEWYFYHGSYSGPAAFTEDVVDRYASSISKPGFLRAMLGPFAMRTVASDATFFNSTIGVTPLVMPVLALGGEASFAAEVESVWGPVVDDLVADVVPKAGHWIADENPVWVANRFLQFLAEDATPPASIDLSSLDNKVTLTVGFYGTLGNQDLAINQPWP
ncbi:Soluble epoxide hydrolase [Cytospora mali]|uniref:Soluble epoxide hydrolase n=1 Tax=Cytospora mali TaxID=578113 RepID=A0A194VS10_CYTMA|nr:Soluble epoxide hydrolase [Valsa mali]